MKWKKWLYRSVLPKTGWIFINILTWTLRIRCYGREEERRLKAEGRTIVYAFWHGRQFLMVKTFSHAHVCVMTSPSRDGRLQARLLQKFGYEIVEGSSHKNPVRALIGSIHKVQQDKCDFVIAVDGPTGPLYKAKPGAVFLAKKTNSVLIPMAFSARPAITMTAWDRYLLPLPFARTVLIFGTPIHPDPDTSPETVEKENLKLEKQLIELTNEADSRVQRRIIQKSD